MVIYGRKIAPQDVLVRDFFIKINNRTAWEFIFKFQVIFK